MEINWLGDGFNQYTGYGRMGAYFIRELSALGVAVTPILATALDAPSWLSACLHEGNFEHITISLMYGEHFRKINGRQWGFTMYEDTSIPPGWAEIINQTCERLLVLCEHNAETFANAGVEVPIHVVYGGTDPNEFPLVERRAERPYTFVCVGDSGMRKGVDVAWQAFNRAFPNGEDVRLIIKTRANGMRGVMTESFHDWDNRIEVWKEDVDDIADVYRRADCFVFPSFGEGWGMPPREAAMMGLPVITTNWAGLAVGIDHWALSVNEYDMRPSHLKTKDAEWAVPHVGAVAEHMRWCYDHQDESKAFGLSASQWLRENQTWTHSAQQIVDLLEDYS